MFGVNESSGMNFSYQMEWMSEVSRSAKTTQSKDESKRPISPFLEVGFDNFFDSHM